MGRIHHPALYATEKPRFTMRMVFSTFRSSIPIEFRPVLRYRRMDCRPEYGTLKSSWPSGSFLSYQKAPTASIAQCPFRITGSDSSLQKKKERRSKRRSFCTAIAPCLQSSQITSSGQRLPPRNCPGASPGPRPSQSEQSGGWRFSPRSWQFSPLRAGRWSHQDP